MSKKNIGRVALIVLAAFCGFKSYGQGNISRTHPAEPEMVFVEGGTFMMGCTPEQESGSKDYEKPAHQVTVSSFSIGKYEITQRQWELLMNSNPSTPKKGDNLPVENVSWDETQEFISVLNAATGKNYRLPTEAEWEYAARGGNQSKGYIYSGSNNLADVAWFYESGNDLHPVGTKQPNELGIYDTSGNVIEWCNDRAEANIASYPVSPQHDPKGPLSGDYRVLRGGSWFSEARQCRVSSRGWHFHVRGFSKSIGFRLVLPVE